MQFSQRHVIYFFAATLLITWGIGGLFFLIPEVLERLTGPLGQGNFLFLLAVYSPAIAAILIVTAVSGSSGLAAFLVRLAQWRAHPGWYCFAILGPLIFGLAGYALSRILGVSEAPPSPAPNAAALTALFTALLIGPVEEIGWRGFALPLLQRRFRPLIAGLIVGSVWGVWHLPAFYISELPQGAFGFIPFLVNTTAVSVILTAVYNGSGGCLLLAVLYHWQLNNPLLPEAMTGTAIVHSVAALALLVLGRKWFATDGCSTRILQGLDA